ncbi:MAG: DEAD/DEAH box helicase [Lishizhenia sp.]
MATFKALGVKPEFIKAFKELNIIEPTEIQVKTLPILLEKQTDFIGQAQTGTGKTLAFGIPLINKINTKSSYTQGLVLSPTRELGQQIAKQLFKFTKYSDKIFTEAVYGGEKIDIQISRLQRPTHIIVATPGRLLDLIERGVVNLDHVKTVILDEADEMLSMGFKDDLEKILSKTHGVQNKWMFSATMPHGVVEIAKKYMAENAVRVHLNSKSIVNSNIQHQYIQCLEEEKLLVLTDFLSSQKKRRGVIFCRTKKSTEKLAKQLKAKNFETAALNGDLTQKEREKVLRAFKNETHQFIIATDVAARGIDVPNLSFVAHYELPDNDEYYTHRSGRTARGGKNGISFVIAAGKDLKQIRYYQKALNISFVEINH